MIRKIILLLLFKVLIIIQAYSAEDFYKKWEIRKDKRWGLENIELIKDYSSEIIEYFRVFYPKDSASPAVSRKEGVPIGGVQFYTEFKNGPVDKLYLRYYVRFAENFDFVKGGKLPGLYGGTVHSGGNIPDGTNGFSTRYMWRRNGDGEIYVYLPTSKKYGTSIDRGNFKFIPGRWYCIEQMIELNIPGQNNGVIKVWLDGKLVINQYNILFRRVLDLKIEGIFFSTFFGGGDISWATPVDTYIDFAEFEVSNEYIGLK